MTASRIDFLRKFFRNPRELGSITPSSRYLTRAVLDEVDLNTGRRFVELGPGTGVFTSEALRRMHSEAELLAIEIDTDFVEQLHREIDDHRLNVVHGPAQQLSELLANRGWQAVDAVISGLPYSLLPRRVTAGIVARSWAALRCGGTFVAYQYSPYLRPFVRARFGHCRLKLVWRNVPPAVVFVGRKRASSENGPT